MYFGFGLETRPERVVITDGFDGDSFGFSLSTTADGDELLVISGGLGGGVE